MLNTEISARAKALLMAGAGDQFDHGVQMLHTALTGHNNGITSREIRPAAEALIAVSPDTVTRCGIVALAWSLGERIELPEGPQPSVVIPVQVMIS